MTAREVTAGSVARCATPATAKPIAPSGVYLTPTQERIVLMLKCLDPCPVEDICRAGPVASTASLRVHISALRRKGYDITALWGNGTRREPAYSLRGEP